MLSISSARATGVVLIAAVLALSIACSGDEPATSTATQVPVPSPTAAAPSPEHVATSVAGVVLDAIAVEPVAWSGCGGGFECGDIVVPMDYAVPNGEKIRLPLLRYPAADSAARIGSLITNPGGPGASGVAFVRRAAKTFFTDEIHERFDIVGFDPRGVGASDPAVDCVDDLDAFVEQDPSPDDQTSLDAAAAAAEALAAGCAERSGGLLAHVSTADVARDLSLLRKAIGDEKLTYAGFSYGTLIGALYADMFPASIRAMLLDGAVDPALSPTDDVRAQILGFEGALEAFLADCARDSGCAFYSDGASGAAFDELMASIEVTPLTSDDGREVGPGLTWLGVAASLYDKNAGWPVLGRALVAARDQRDGTLFARLADALTGRRDNGSYDDELEQRIAVSCVDFPHLTPAETQALRSELSTAAPRFGPNSGLAGKDPCDFWPVPPQRTPAAVVAAGAPPIMVVGTTGDPATPYTQAVALASQLRSGALFTYRGEGHTAYGKGVTCVNAAVDAYLIELVAPGKDAEC